MALAAPPFHEFRIKDCFIGARNTGGLAVVVNGFIEDDVNSGGTFLQNPDRMAASYGYCRERNELYFFTTADRIKNATWSKSGPAAEAVLSAAGQALGTKKLYSYKKTPGIVCKNKWQMDIFQPNEGATMAVRFYEESKGKKYIPFVQHPPLTEAQQQGVLSCSMGLNATGIPPPVPPNLDQGQRLWESTIRKWQERGGQLANNHGAPPPVYHNVPFPALQNIHIQNLVEANPAPVYQNIHNNAAGNAEMPLFEQLLHIEGNAAGLQAEYGVDQYLEYIYHNEAPVNLDGLLPPLDGFDPMAPVDIENQEDQ